jgi:hypothetical protein
MFTPTLQPGGNSKQTRIIMQYSPVAQKHIKEMQAKGMVKDGNNQRNNQRSRPNSSKQKKHVRNSPRVVNLPQVQTFLRRPAPIHFANQQALEQAIKAIAVTMGMNPEIYQENTKRGPLYRLKLRTKV